MAMLLATRLPTAARSACLKTASATSLSRFTTSVPTRAERPVDPDAHKEYQERETITVLKDEYSKTGGGDSAVAQQDVASYGAADTDPASQQQTAGEGNAVNPLEVSPANREVSRISVEEEVHVGSGVEKTAASRRSGPAKGTVAPQYETGERARAAPVGSRQVG